jgi:hypothetical protein
MKSEVEAKLGNYWIVGHAANLQAFAGWQLY